MDTESNPILDWPCHGYEQIYHESKASDQSGGGECKLKVRGCELNFAVNFVVFQQKIN